MVGGGRELGPKRRAKGAGLGEEGGSAGEAGARRVSGGSARFGGRCAGRVARGSQGRGPLGGGRGCVSAPSR